MGSRSSDKGKKALKGAFSHFMQNPPHNTPIKYRPLRLLPSKPIQ
jgi:hypothetical protein